MNSSSATRDSTPCATMRPRSLHMIACRSVPTGNLLKPLTQMSENSLSASGPFTRCVNAGFRPLCR